VMVRSFLISHHPKCVKSAVVVGEPYAHTIVE